MTDLPPDFDIDEYRRRQKSRARIMGAALIALAALFFFITIAKIGLAA
jgi:hypothetical protein